MGNKLSRHNMFVPIEKHRNPTETKKNESDETHPMLLTKEFKTESKFLKLSKDNAEKYFKENNLNGSKVFTDQSKMLCKKFVI